MKVISAAPGGVVRHSCISVVVVLSFGLAAPALRGQILQECDPNQVNVYCTPGCEQYDPASDPDECNCAIVPGSFEHQTIVSSQLGHVRMTLRCSPPPGLREADFSVKNTSTDRIYRVKVRAEVVCPPDPGEPPVCMCPEGFQDWFDPNMHLCNDHACNADPSDFLVPYPKQFNDGLAECARAGDWIWCTVELNPGATYSPGGLRPLSGCCDCDRVRKDIACGQVDTLAYSVVGTSTWIDVADPGYDVQGECRAAAFLHDVQNAPFTCFQPLASYCPKLSAVSFARPETQACTATSLFLFSSSSASPQFECRLDGGSYSACSSPHTVNVGDGSHSFYVRDRSVSNPTVDRYQWSVSSAPGCDGNDTVFRLTRTIGGDGKTNLIALPYGNVFQGSGGPEKLCQAFDLGADATITQYSGQGAT